MKLQIQVEYVGGNLSGMVERQARDASRRARTAGGGGAGGVLGIPDEKDISKSATAALAAKQAAFYKLSQTEQRYAVERARTLATKINDVGPGRIFETAGRSAGESWAKGMLASIGEGSPFMVGMPLMAARGLSRVMAGPAMASALPMIGGAALAAGAGYMALREYGLEKGSQANEGLLGRMSGASAFSDRMRFMGAPAQEGSLFGLLGGPGFLNPFRERQFNRQSAMSFGELTPARDESAFFTAERFRNVAASRGMTPQDLKQELSGMVEGVPSDQRMGFLSQILELQSGQFAKSKPSAEATRAGMMKIESGISAARTSYELRQRVAESFQQGQESATLLKSLKLQAGHQREITSERASIVRDEARDLQETDPVKRFKFIRGFDEREKLLAIKEVNQQQQQLEQSYADAKTRFATANDRYESALNEWMRGKEAEGNAETLTRRFNKEQGAPLFGLRLSELRRLQEIGGQVTAGESAIAEKVSAINEQFRQLGGVRGTEENIYKARTGAKLSGATFAGEMSASEIRSGRMGTTRGQRAAAGLSRAGGLISETSKQAGFALSAGDTVEQAMILSQQTANQEALVSSAESLLFELGRSPREKAEERRANRRIRKQVERGGRRAAGMMAEEAFDASHVGRAWQNSPDAISERRQVKGTESSVENTAADRMMQAANLFLQAAGLLTRNTGGKQPPRMTMVPVN